MHYSKMYRNMLVFTGEYVPHWNGKQMLKYMKETRRKKITVRSSLNEIFTDQVGNRMVVRGEGVTLPPALSTAGF